MRGPHEIRNKDEIGNAGQQIKTKSKAHRQLQFAGPRDTRVGFEALLDFGREFENCGLPVCPPLHSIAHDLVIDKQGCR